MAMELCALWIWSDSCGYTASYSWLTICPELTDHMAVGYIWNEAIYVWLNSQPFQLHLWERIHPYFTTFQNFSLSATLKKEGIFGKGSYMAILPDSHMVTNIFQIICTFCEAFVHLLTAVTVGVLQYIVEGKPSSGAPQTTSKCCNNTCLSSAQYNHFFVILLSGRGCFHHSDKISEPSFLSI